MPSSYAAKRSLLDLHAGEVEVVITGHSHALRGVRPAFLSRPALNLANVSQSLHYDTGLVVAWLPRLARLRLVILCVSALSFQYRLDRSPEAWRAPFYGLEFGLPGEAGPWTLGDPARHLALPNFGIEAVRRFALTGRALDPGIASDGWSAFPASLAPPGPTVAGGAARAALHRGMMSEGYVRGNLDAVGRLARALRARGIAAVLVAMPVAGTYSDALGPAALDRMRSALKEAERAHGIPHRDFTLDRRFSPDDFFDDDHLNARGAERFSVMLDEEVVRPTVSPRGEIRNSRR